MAWRHFCLIALAGTASANIGCSEAVPPANQGSVLANFSSTPTGDCAGMTCPCGVDIHKMQIGFAHASDSGQITFVKDGEAGADVFCSVTPSGDGFQAQGAFEVGADVFEYKVNLAATNDEANKATGSVSYRTVNTVSKYTSPPETPCNFWVTPSQEVAAGRIWAQFECPQILNLSAGRGCAIGQSTIAMQNCDQ